jgi:serine/threonine protein phosphatase PrpC
MPTDFYLQLREALLTELITGWLARTTKTGSISEIRELSVSLGTTIGVVRKENQDRAVVVRYTSIVPQRSFVSMVLCDGMGGMKDGGSCAEIAVAAFIKSLMSNPGANPTEQLGISARAANIEVYRRYKERGGTTLAAILHSEDAVFGVSVGDSRIYRFRANQPSTQISIDDTVSDELKKATGHRESASYNDPFAGQLTQFVGIGDVMQAKVYALQKLDAYLLTSDGAHNMARSTFDQIVSSAAGTKEIVSRLLSVSNWCGGRDNATVICTAGASYSKIPPRFANAEGWLELWDSERKLELPIEKKWLEGIQPTIELRENPASRPKPSDSDPKSAPIPSETVPHVSSDVSQPKAAHAGSRPRKGKKNSQHRRGQAGTPAAAQPSLQIEIVDPSADKTEKSEHPVDDVPQRNPGDVSPTSDFVAKEQNPGPELKPADLPFGNDDKNRSHDSDRKRTESMAETPPLKDS